MAKKQLPALVLVVAFAALPTAAQAAPHWYSNGAIVGEAPVATVSSGTLTELANKYFGAASIQCRVVTGGFVKNPGGGGAGEGKTQEFAYYECTANYSCTPGHPAAQGVPASLQGASGGWPSNLEEPKAGEIRVNTTGVELELGCVQPPEFNKITGTTVVTSPTALQNPLGPSGPRKGTSASAPGTTVFDEKTGELELPKMGANKVRTIGTLVTLGYDEQELIQIKSP